MQTILDTSLRTSDFIIIIVLIVIRICESIAGQVIGKRLGYRLGWLKALIFGFPLYLTNLLMKDDYLKRPKTTEYSVDKDWNEETQWFCRKCNKIHPLTEDKCTCGYTLAEFRTYQKQVKIAKLLNEINATGILNVEKDSKKIEKYLDQNLNLYEIVILEILQNNSCTSDELNFELPACEDKKPYYNALNNLLSRNFVIKDNNDKYTVAFKI